MQGVYFEFRDERRDPNVGSFELFWNWNYISDHFQHYKHRQYALLLSIIKLDADRAVSLAAAFDRMDRSFYDLVKSNSYR